MFTLLTVTLYFTTAYHPQADRQSEQTNQTVKLMIQHILQEDAMIDWEDKLPMVQYCLNRFQNTSTNETPHCLLYGMDLHRPWELMKQVFNQSFGYWYNTEVSQSLTNIIIKHHYNCQHIPKSFNVGDQVYLHLYSSYNIPANWGKNKKIGQCYTGPFTIVERVGHLAYCLKLLSHWNIHDVINITFLEPAPAGSDPFNHVPAPPEAVHDEYYPNKDDWYDVEHVLAKHTRHIRCV